MDAPLRRGFASLRVGEFGVPFVELLGEGLLLLGGVPGGVLEFLKGPLAPLDIVLCGCDPRGVFLLCGLCIFEGLLEGLDLFSLLFIQSGEGGAFRCKGLHAVCVALKGAFGEGEARLERREFRITRGDRLLILRLALDCELC
ncbi:hypothetical protein SDC9_160526 [bioreactor metagenome]|uniref:Uncharacterized protein n=1 Tax=bioreactor metagenome TaxID=1076179 RepID=A0A645FHV3_9ZZZZ